MPKKDTTNRDTNRQNKASTLVNACLYSNVAKEGIESCISIIDREDKSNPQSLFLNSYTT